MDSGTKSDESFSRSSGPPSAGPDLLQVHSSQLNFLDKLIRTIWKHRSSYPFREPVDPIKHNIPDYFDVIKQPMDLSTIRSKLSNHEYSAPEECINDFRLMISNCYTYNPEGLPVRDLCREIELQFEKKIAELPTVAQQPQLSLHSTTPSLPSKRKISASSPVKKKSSAYENTGNSGNKEAKKTKTYVTKKSLDTVTTNAKFNHLHSPVSPATTTTSISATSASAHTHHHATPPRSSNSTNNVSSTREITRAIKKPTKDWPEQDKNVVLSPSFSFCMDALNELFNKKHYSYAWPFYSPVDATMLNIPDYTDVIQFPMDLSTIKKKLKSGQYIHPQQFVNDVRLVFTNCYRYNAQATEVVTMANKLQCVFEGYISLVPKELFQEFFVYDVNGFIDNPATNTALVGGIAGGVSSNAGMRNSRRQVQSDNRFVMECFQMLDKKVQHISDELAKLRNDKSLSNLSTSQHHYHTTSTKPYSNNVDTHSQGLRHGQSVAAAANRINNSNNNPSLAKSATSSFSTFNTTDLDKSDDAEPMTYEEKRELSSQLSCLNEANLKEVLGIIYSKEPSLRRIGPGMDSMEIDVDGLAPSTLRALEKFVHNSKRRKSEATYRKKFTAKEQAQRKEELVKRLKSYDSQLSGKTPILRGKTDLVGSLKPNGGGAGGSLDLSTASGGGIQDHVLSRLSESGSSSEDDDNDITTTRTFAKVHEPLSHTTSHDSLQNQKKPLIPSSTPSIPRTIPHGISTPGKTMLTASQTMVSSSTTSSSLTNPLANENKQLITFATVNESVITPNVASKIKDRVEPRNVLFGQQASDTGISANTTGSSSNSSNTVPFSQPVKALPVPSSPSKLTPYSVSRPTTLIPSQSASSTLSIINNNLSDVEKKKAEEKKRRMALVGTIDMNAQGDLLNTFEEKF